jgi:hypothetical protein
VNLKTLHARLDKLDAELPVRAPAVVRNMDLTRLSKDEQLLLDITVTKMTVVDGDGNIQQNLDLLSIEELKTLSRIVRKMTANYI